MPVAQPQLGNEGLLPGTHRVLLAGAVEGLRHPPVCPHCGVAATRPLPVAKVFMHNDGDQDGGWRYRIARATPLFCDACLRRHADEALPVTLLDRLKSGLFTELALPGLGTTALALFLLQDAGPRSLPRLDRDWPILALIGVLLLIGLSCLRLAWTGNAHRRVPAPTPTSRAFDFGDNEASAFRTTLRTYAIRSAAHAEAFQRLNAGRSDALTGPAQRRRESRRFWITAAVIAALAAALHVLGPG